MRISSVLGSLLVCGLLATACTTDTGGRRAEPPATPTVPALEPGGSLTGAGLALYRSSRPQEQPRPRYAVRAEVDPESGGVHGIATVTVPVREGGASVTFRFFPGLPDLEAEPRVGDVQVDGAAVQATLDASILRVPLPEAHEGPDATVVVPFGYTLPLREPEGALGGPLGGELTPAEIGLLARRPDAVNLGHWLPLWVPEGRSADPVPDGFGDLGNFSAAEFHVELEAPEGWTVVDSGVRSGQETEAGRTTVVSEGVGLRDFSVALLRRGTSRTRELDGALDGVTIAATAPVAQADQLDAVLDETEVAMRTLSAAYGPYPWREFDVVSAPLGASVGGMEWPGATWIESGLFGGALPGLGDLEDLGLGDLEALEDLDLGELGDLAGLGDLDVVLDTARPWTIAHEVAHSWWTVVVGNDSVEAPVVDEPLAQYAACLVVRDSLPDGEAACRAQVVSGYEQMRMLGVPDAPADRATDEFAGSLQYGGLVYGKAAAFYLQLEDRFGAEEVTEALRTLVRRQAFRSVSSAEVRAALVRSLGPAAGASWDRWMEGTHGDADLAVDGP